MKQKITLGSIFAKMGMYLVLLFVFFISVFPVIWVLVSSIKTNQEILSGPFSIPAAFRIDSYTYLFTNNNFGRYFMNSIFVSFLPTIVSVIIFSMAAYVIAKYDFPFKSILYGLLVMTLLVPAHARTQPIFSLIFKLNLYDNLFGVALVYLSTGLAVSMFVLRSGFMAIPKELTEAATIDGAGFFRTFYRINLPLASNSLVTAGILMFLANWNEYYFASLLTSEMSNKTLPTISSMFITQFSYDYPKTFAALALLIVPGIILYALVQERVQQSVASSGIKG